MNRLLLSIVAIVAFFEASAQNNQVIVSFKHQYGSNTLQLHESIFPIWNNKLIRIDRAEFYLSETEILQQNGASVLMSEKYMLVDARYPNQEHDMGQWPVENAQAVTTHLGVPKVQNHADPSLYPAGHPLALQEPTMHWGWAGGYRFMAIEGLIDNDGNGVPETLFELHNVGDDLYKTVTLTGSEVAANGVLHLHFKLDYVKLFENIAMTGSLVQHSNAGINAAMMNNAAAQGFISMESVSNTKDLNAEPGALAFSPNPSNETTWVKYETNAQDAVELSLVNALGEKVLSLNNLQKSGEIQLQTGSINAGNYQCVLTEKGRLLKSEKLIVMH